MLHIVLVTTLNWKMKFDATLNCLGFFKFWRQKQFFFKRKLSCTLLDLINERRTALDRPSSMRRFEQMEIVQFLQQILQGLEVELGKKTKKT